MPHFIRSSWFKCTQIIIIHKYNFFPNIDIAFALPTNKNQYLDTLNKRKRNALSDAQYWLWYTPQKCQLCGKTSSNLFLFEIIILFFVLKTKRRSDSVLRQKPLHQQKCQKGKVTTQTTPQKGSSKRRLRTNLGRSVRVTTAIQLVWLTEFRVHLPTPRNSREIRRTYI